MTRAVSPRRASAYEYVKALERNWTGARAYPQFQVHFGRVDAVIVGSEVAVAVEAKGTLNGGRMASLDGEILRLDDYWLREAITDRLSMPAGFALWGVAIADTFEMNPSGTVDWRNEWWLDLHLRSISDAPKAPNLRGLRSLTKVATKNEVYAKTPGWWHLLGYKQVTTTAKAQIGYLLNP